MCSSLLSCPLCCLSSFPDLETFKLNLIKVNSKPIKCPFPQCDEILLGLDKLTIHLFGHSLPIVVDPSPACQPQQTTTQQTFTDQQQSMMQTQSNYNDLPSVPAIVKATRHTRAKMAKSTISSSVSLSSHQTKSTTATSDDPSFRCQICGFIFYDENLLNLHLSLVHNFIPSNRQHDDSGGIDNNNANNNGEKGNSSQTTDSSDEIKKFHCHLCSKHFKKEGNWERAE